ncbi:hypothetical protein JCM16814_24260 [Desulfobaculum senezii]
MWSVFGEEEGLDIITPNVSCLFISRGRRANIGAPANNKIHSPIPPKNATRLTPTPLTDTARTEWAARNHAPKDNGGTSLDDDLAVMEHQFIYAAQQQLGLEDCLQF